MSYRNKVVFITGASSGIGAALAREVAGQGANVALLGRRKDRLEALKAEIEAMGRKAVAIECDVCDDKAMEAAVTTTLQALEKIDVVVANAGFGVAGKIYDLELDDFRRQFETNFFGVLRTIFATIHELKRTKGSLVLIGSVSGYVGLGGNSAYTASKFAIHGLANSLRHELRPRGIAVTLIAPGFVDSEIRRVDNSGKLVVEAKEPIPGWLVMSTDKAVREIAWAIAARKPERVITAHGKIAVWFQRHFPVVMSWVVSKAIRARPEPGANKSITGPT